MKKQKADHIKKLSLRQKQALLALEKAYHELMVAGLTDGNISWLESCVPYKYLPNDLARSIEIELLTQGHASLTLQLCT